MDSCRECFCGQFSLFCQALPSETADVGWHWDRDYEVEAAGICLYPHISTVTYLSDGGAPTVVLKSNQTPLLMSDEVAATATDCFISHPSCGKHISFDGQLLHSAPSILAR